VIDKKDDILFYANSYHVYNQIFKSSTLNRRSFNIVHLRDPVGAKKQCRFPCREQGQGTSTSPCENWFDGRLSLKGVADGVSITQGGEGVTFPWAHADEKHWS